MEGKTKDKAKTGPASFEEMYGEPFTALRFKLPERQLAYLKREALKGRVSIAEFLRALIEREMVRIDPRTEKVIKAERKPAEREGVDIPF